MMRWADLEDRQPALAEAGCERLLARLIATAATGTGVGGVGPDRAADRVFGRVAARHDGQRAAVEVGGVP
jgi:hypothetical protein